MVLRSRICAVRLLGYMAEIGVIRLLNKTFAGVMFALFLIGMMTLPFNIKPVEASGTIYIRADGSVDPPTAPIQRDGDIYTLTGNITSDTDGIVVERDNIVVDGLGYTVQGTDVGSGIRLFFRSNVTIKNMRVIAFYSGIDLGYSLNNAVSNNNITNNSEGIYLHDYCDSNTIANNTIESSIYIGVELTLSSHNNTIVGNNIANNSDYGIYFWNSSGNIIIGNSITENSFGGICLNDSSNSTIVGNNIATSEDSIGIYVVYSRNCSISNNNVTNSYYGLDLLASSHNSFSGNAINNAMYSICIESSSDSGSLSHFIHSIDVSNLVDGKPVYYLVNQTDLVINPVTHPQIGYLAMVNCANVTVEGLTKTDYVLLAYTRNSTIVDNSGFGISVQYSSSNVISRNNMTHDYAVYLYNSSSNILSENNITNSYIGILLRRSSCNVLRNNDLVNNTCNFGISTWALEFSHFINDVDLSNTVDGKPIYYWINRHNEQVPSDAGYVALVNSTNIVVKELELKNNAQSICLAYTTNSQIISNSITNNNVGVYLYESSFINLSENHMTNNDYTIYSDFSSDNVINRNNITNNGNGVGLINTSNCSVSGNNVVNNYLGIALSSSFNCSVFHNNVSNNTYGICLYYSSDNTIEHNNFIGNTVQTYGYDSINNWDQGYPSGGNYWSNYSGVDLYSGPYQNDTGSDGIGDTPYIIDSNNVDNYPLMIPWEYPIGYESNTTITNVVVTRKTLSFETSGPDGTTGFITVTMPMDFNNTAIKVFVDDVEITPTITTNGTHYFIYFEFIQSIHNITIRYAIVDIALTNLTTSKTVVCQEYCINITVTVENQGSSTENFEITVYANTTTIDTKPVTITAWGSTTVIFTWNTSGFAKGNYTITAYATPVLGETATADNTLVAEDEVCVSILGDLDADFDVDLYDAVKLLKIYGAKEGSPIYDPNCDIDGDGIIDLYDAVRLLTNYGKKDP